MKDSVKNAALAAALAADIGRRLQELRRLLPEPVSIPYGGEVAIEVRPLEDDQRVMVTHQRHGAAVVNYTGEGVILDVFPREGIEPVHTQAIEAGELVQEAHCA